MEMPAATLGFKVRVFRSISRTQNPSSRLFSNLYWFNYRYKRKRKRIEKGKDQVSGI